MKVFYVDLQGVGTKEELYDLLEKELPLPSGTGRNLDALFDVFSEYGAKWMIIFYNISKTGENLKEYQERLCRMCRDAEKACGIQIRIYP